MSIDMSTVGAITHNNKTVDIIEDINNDIIWASHLMYPYRLLEYIDIPSGCYFDLNVEGSDTTGVTLIVNPNLNSGSISSDIHLFGSIKQIGSTYYRYHITATSSANYRAVYANQSYQNTPLLFNNSDSNNKYTIELNNHTYNDKKAYVNNTDKGTFSPSSTYTTGSLYLGGRGFYNSSGTLTSVVDYPLTIRFYEGSIQTASDTTYTLIPVERKSDNKIGILRIYNNGSTSFLTSKTSTEPIEGTTINEYYDPHRLYRRLEYLIFSGTEYVDTELQPTNKTQFSMILKFNDEVTSTSYNGKGYMGVRNRYGIGHNQGVYFLGLGNWVTTSINCDTTDYHTVTIRPNGFTTNPGYKIDNGSWINPDNNSMIDGGTGSVFIGASNSTNGPTAYIKQNVKSVTLSGQTIATSRQLIPCQRKSDNLCGFFDTSNYKFHPMIGTNIHNEAAGPTVNEYWLNPW